MLWQMKKLYISNSSPQFTWQNKFWAYANFFPRSLAFPVQKQICEPRSGSRARAIRRRHDLLTGRQAYIFSPAIMCPPWQEARSRVGTPSAGHHPSADPHVHFAGHHVLHPSLQKQQAPSVGHRIPPAITLHTTSTATYLTGYCCVHQSWVVRKNIWSCAIDLHRSKSWVFSTNYFSKDSWMMIHLLMTMII
jgi:hypothetical protein